MAEQYIVEAVNGLYAKPSERKFAESIELAVNLRDVDLTVPKNRIEEEILLPKGRGKAVKVGIFARGELAHKAQGVADVIIPAEEIDDLAGNKRKAKKLANQVTFFLAEAPLMPSIGKSLGVVLGPRGKMPRPVPPAADPGPIVKNLRNTVKIRTKDRPSFHVYVGTKSMKPEDVAENLEVVIKRIVARLEKGQQNIRSAFIKTTMGKSVRISFSSKGG
jgi:large subunit ribosomal protein L1